MYFESGDQVSVVIPQENREWGYNPCDDGTIATVVKYGTITNGRNHRNPGVYENTSWIEITTGKKTWTEYAFRCTLVDEVEREKRRNIRYEGKFLEDLPETKFWELDNVKAKQGSRFHEIFGGEVTQILNINYNHIDSTCTDGSPFPIYDIRIPGGGGHTSAKEKELELISRGNIWKRNQGEGLSFDSLSEEAEFHKLLGLYDEVRNPKYGNFRWDGPEDFIPLIEQGLADAISCGVLIVPYTSVMRFHDRDLGRRIAEETLRGFPEYTRQGKQGKHENH